MNDSNYIKLYSGNLVITEQIKQSLESQGISAVVKAQNESNLNPIFGGHLVQELYVHKDELDRAVEIVESITSHMNN